MEQHWEVHRQLRITILIANGTLILN